MRIKINELKNLCFQILTNKGLSQKDADLIFNEYLDAELRGRACHGFQAFKQFGAKLANPTGNPKVIKEDDNFLFIDGQQNFGQVICNEFVPKLIDKAKKKHVAMMGIKNMHSYLMPGTYARMAAEKNVVALIFNYGGAPRICPAGSIDPIFGTNPIAIGIPSEELPIVIDMATSKTSMMNIRLAKKLGQEIETDLCLDKNGNSTTDPEKAIEGALLPFGGYKGAALSLAIEVLTRTMFGIQKKEEGRGFLFVFINPESFQEITQFKGDVSMLMRKIKNSRKEGEIEEIFLPGEHSERIKLENEKKDYLELDDKIIKEIKALV